MSDQFLTHRFVETAPEQLEPSVLYVSVEFAMVMHLCCCGCGSEVVTPLSPKDWKLTFDGESITLYPSIGNWSFPCKSHYWIRHDRVEWAPQWTDAEIRKNREQDPDSSSDYLQREWEQPKPPSYFQKVWQWMKKISQN